MIPAIELMAAARAIDFRRQDMPGAQRDQGTQLAYDLVRARVPFIERDTVMYPHMEALSQLVAGGELARAVAPLASA
jgi:histidine ammonia-lyase